MRRRAQHDDAALPAPHPAEAALRDPAGFIAGLDGPVLIDEIQRAPELLLEIKKAVDRDTTPGRFLLTGSANILSSKRVVDALKAESIASVCGRWLGRRSSAVS